MIDLVPGPPDYNLDWTAFDARIDWVRAMRDCPQDPVYHAEGNVWIHTAMVLEALTTASAYRNAPADVRTELFLAALLHDVAKPLTTQVREDGRITASGHAQKGMMVARQLLWRAGVEPIMRERIAHMIGHHQLPLWCIEREQPERHTILASLVCRLDRLTVLANADMRGRICDDQQTVLDRIRLFRMLAADEECFTAAASFANEHSRLIYCRKPDQHRSVALHFEPTYTMTIMCGLPAAGKSTWVRTHRSALPVVSLDQLRSRMKVAPSKNQGRVVKAAKMQAREHLRTRQSFVWDATNLTPRHRALLIQLGLDYGARVEIIHVETDMQTARSRNATREKPVPDRILDRMIARWQPPTPMEAHHVQLVMT